MIITLDETKNPTLPQTLAASAEAAPDKIALSDNQRQYTYSQLLKTASVLSARVREMSDRPNIGVLLPNSAWFGVAFYACQLAGKAVIPLSQILRPADLTYALDDGKVDLLITTRSVAAPLQQWPGKRLYMEDFENNSEIATGASCTQPPIMAQPDDAAAILYTAGSEAEPKGVILTHRNLLSNVAGVCEIARLSCDDVYLGILPMSHAFALMGTLIAPIALTARVHYLDRFIPSEIGEACLTHQVTILMAVPSMYNILVRAHDQSWAARTPLRLCVSGGEALPRGVADRFEDVFLHPLLNGYGMTETSPVISMCVPWANKPGSVGRPLPGVEVRIVDDDDQPLEADQEGEIVVRGPNLMKGYLNHPQYTAEKLTADGFLRTGDIGLLDRDGYLHIRGRKKEIIIISGENVAPAEIEAVLLSHPKVADASVIGVTHATRGEAPVAFVIPRRFQTLTPQELRHYCRERIAAFKIPRKFILRTTLPRNAAGRILKRDLKTMVDESEAMPQ